MPADECVRIATVQAVVPDVPGPLALDLTYEGGDVKVANHYDSVILRSS